MPSPGHIRRVTVIRTGVVGIAVFTAVLLLDWFATRRPYHLALGPEPIVHHSPAAAWDWLITASAFGFVIGLFCVLFAALPSRAVRITAGSAAVGAVIAIAFYFADRVVDLYPHVFLALYPTSILFLGLGSHAPPGYAYVVFAFSILANALFYALVGLALWAVWWAISSAQGAATK
jgi:hypothetical protein